MLEASHFLNADLAADDLPFALVVLYLGLEGALFHLQVFRLLLVAGLLLLLLLPDVVEALCPLAVGHIAAGFVDLWLVSWTFGLFDFTKVMLVAVDVHLPGYFVDFRVEVAVSIGLCLDARNLVFLLKERSTAQPIHLFLACLVLSVLHHDAGNGVDAWDEGVVLLIVAAGSIDANVAVCYVVVDGWSEGQLFLQVDLNVLLERSHPFLLSFVVFNEAVHYVLHHSLLH